MIRQGTQAKMIAEKYSIPHVSTGDIFRANIVDVSTESVIIELTGAQSKLNAFIELLNGFKITELARTGITGLARGTASLK